MGMRLGFVCAAAAACGHAPAGEPPANHAASPTGCPAPDAFYAVARFERGADRSIAPTDPPSGWRVVLGEGNLGAGDAEDGSGHTGPIDPAAAAKLGARPAPSALWLLSPGRDACRATVGSGLLDAQLFGDAFDNEISAPLDGCMQLAGDAAAPVALAADAPRCRYAPIAMIAERESGEDQHGEWTSEPKTSLGPVPDAIARTWSRCDPPDCQRLWRVEAIAAEGRTYAYQVTTTVLHRDPAAPATCPYVAGDGAQDFRVYWVGAGGALEELWAKDQTMRDHVAGVLYDDRGPRYLVGEQPERWKIEPVAGDQIAEPAATLFWRRVSNDEASMEPHVTRGCGG